MNIHRHTKIIATIGPASSSAEQISALIEAGVSLFRMNFSHGDHEGHRKIYETIRACAEQAGQRIGVAADLQGPKLRIGTFKDGSIDLTVGQSLRFDLDKAAGDQTRVNLPHPEILDILEEGHIIFLDDGKVRVRVTGKSKGVIEAKVETGNKLSDRKGFNIPDIVIPLAALTEKDKKDLEFALELGVDWIAQSFVQTASDVQEAQKLIKGRAKLMAKIEKPSALKHLVEITEIADGIMLARGDLGVEIPPEKVPAVQKRVVRQVHESGKPIIVATQMLESMVESARPTRAEASDVATAVYDGADAVMLSAETAVGKHPVKAVQIMDRICHETENDEIYQQMMDASLPDSIHDSSDAITSAAHYVAEDIGAAFIVTYTTSGSTALRMARMRPDMPILCLTPDKRVAQSLSISYGIKAVYAPETVAQDFEGPARHAAKVAVKMGLGEVGDIFVMTAGVPFGTPGSTNMLRIGEIEAD
jgi:pyruvate kinase